MPDVESPGLYKKMRYFFHPLGRVQPPVQNVISARPIDEPSCVDFAISWEQYLVVGSSKIPTRNGSPHHGDKMAVVRTFIERSSRGRSADD